MKGGTLAVCRSIRLFPEIKHALEVLGFTNVKTTGEEKDSLNRVINEMQPGLLMLESNFYKAGTPYMMGRLVRSFPKLNLAVINMSDFPDELATWFIWRGAKSYVNLQEGYEEFLHGMSDIREGKAYIAPIVLKLMEAFPEWPENRKGPTKRQMEILILVCNGFKPENIGKNLHVSRATVHYNLDQLYKEFNVKNRAELFKVAISLKLVTEKDMVFYDRENKTKELPAWAVTEIKVNRRLLGVSEN